MQRRESIFRGIAAVFFLALLAVVPWMWGEASRATTREARALASMLGWEMMWEINKNNPYDPTVHNGEGFVADPWGKSFRFEYEKNEDHELLKGRSAGPDGVFDTDDDIAAGWTVRRISPEDFDDEQPAGQNGD